MILEVTFASESVSRVFALRHERGWSKEELAARSKHHWTHIGGVERGERNPTLLVIASLATALKIKIADFFPD